MTSLNLLHSDYADYISQVWPGQYADTQPVVITSTMTTVAYQLARSRIHPDWTPILYIC